MSESPNRVGFDLGRVMRTNYRIDDFQETYFVLDSPDSWPVLDLEELIPLWRELDLENDLAPGDLLESDVILHRGRRQLSRCETRCGVTPATSPFCAFVAAGRGPFQSKR